MKEKAIGKIIAGLLICLMLGLVFGGLIDTTSAAQPDLMVVDIWIEPVEFHPGDTIKLYARIKNIGTGDAVGTFKVKRHYNGHVSTSTKDGLAAGKSFKTCRSWAWPSDCNSHTIKVVVDNDGTIAESNEGNNERSESFSAICEEADLIVTSVNAPTSAKPGGYVAVSWTVKCQGNAPSGSFYNRISLATVPYGTDISLGNFPMSSIAPGSSSSDVQVPKIPETVSSGYYYVTVFADAFQTVSESDEYNNINKAHNQIHIASENQPPNRPTNIAPSDGATDVSLTPTLSASAFSDPDSGDTHWKTWWDVKRADNNALAWDSGWRTFDLTSTTVPSGKLDDSRTYKWRVRYMDNHGTWSEPLAIATTFTTLSENQPPNTPSRPSGPSSGYTGTSYSYSTSATDLDGDQVKYAFDWGDGQQTTTGFYNSGATATASHSWSNEGTFYIKVKAMDSKGASSGWSSPKTVTIERQNHKPSAYIDSISPNPAKQGQTVSFNGRGTDPDGDSIAGWNWRASKNGFLSSSKSFSKSDLSVGTHTIYFKVKDSHGLWSDEVTKSLTIKEPSTILIKIDDWSAEPEEVKLGEKVTLKFKFTNTGDIPWTFYAALSLRRPDNTVDNSPSLKAVTLSPTQQGSAEWTYSIDMKGNWDVVFGVWGESSQQNSLGNTGWLNDYIRGVSTSVPCFDGQRCYSTKEEVVSHVPTHVVPRDCFVWKDGPPGYPWRPIPGTGCAHWVAHQLGIRRGATCYDGYSIRVRDVIYGRTEVEISSCKVGDIWTYNDRTHCGIVRQLGNGKVWVEHDSSVQGGVVKSWFSLGKCWTLQPNQPPICAFELRRQGTTTTINEIGVGEFFDICVGDSTDDTGIKEVRFSSDDSQDGNPTGTWKGWYDWDTSSGDWNAISKTKAWLFTTEGSKEVWAEVKDGDGQTGKCSANIVTENLYWLSKAIMSEASVGRHEERIAVGWTVLNRQDSNEFPSTIKKVVESGYAYNQEPTQDIIDLSKDILERKYSDPTRGATYFFSPRSMTSGYGPYKIPGTNKKSHIPSWAIPKGYSKASPPPSDWEMTEFYKTIENLEWVSGLNNVRNWYFMFYRPISSPSVAKPVITTPLEITVKDIYYVEDTLAAKFTITNRAAKSVTFDVLVVGGRDPTGEVVDFDKTYDVALNPGDSYTSHRHRLSFFKPLKP